jgi:beta-lactamase regulating signal transducer with metallopeptidase domain
MTRETSDPELIEDPVALAQHNLERARRLYAKTLLEALAKKLAHPEPVERRAMERSLPNVA